MTFSVRRSLLFVPGCQPGRFDKAAAAGADVVCIDLEDAVPPEQKDEARAAVVTYMNGERAIVEWAVRSNRVGDHDGLSDLTALAALKSKPDLVVLPKVESAEEVQQAASILSASAIKLVALIESPIGLLNAQSIAAAGDPLVAIMFGGADFAAELGAQMSWEPLLYARCHLAVVAAAHGLELIDVPFLDIKDSAGLKTETDRIIAMGFTAKAAIHPSQVSVINDCFTPGPEQLVQAMRIVSASNNCGGGALLVEGKMVDKAVVTAASRTVAIAKAAGLI